MQKKSYILNRNKRHTFNIVVKYKSKPVYMSSIYIYDGDGGGPPLNLPHLMSFTRHDFRTSFYSAPLTYANLNATTAILLSEIVMD